MTHDRVIDYDIDAAEARDRNRDQPVDFCKLRDVGLLIGDFDAKFALQLPLRGGTFLCGRYAVQDDIASLCCQRLGDREAQSCGRTRDQSTPAGKDGGHLKNPRDA